MRGELGTLKSSNIQDNFHILGSDGTKSFGLDIGLGIENLSSIQNYYSMDYYGSSKILGFENLEDGWHFGEGYAINKDIIKKALKLDKEAFECRFFETDAFPGLDGEIAFTIYYQDDYFEFIIENNEMVNYFHEYKDVEVDCESNISFHEALDKIVMLKEEICSLSEYSISNIGINESNDSPALPLNISGIVFQSYPKTVSIERSENFVNILNFFTQQLPDIPSSIGDSQNMIYPMIS